MKNRLEGKVAIVTGGGTGIGEAICKKFAQEGARVVVAGFPEDPVDDVVKEIQKEGGEAIAYNGDISKEVNAKECVELAVKEYGQLDILINNAGVFPEVNMLQDYTEEALDYMIKNNIKSAFAMSKAALPELHKTKGNIVSAGSEAGVIGIAQNAPYGGTKGFIHAFMKGLAVEQSQFGVRVNVVGPGPIDTAWTHKSTGPMDKKMVKTMKVATPMGRRGSPEEVANVYCFLASDEASYVTGALYMVDGGITVTKGPVGEEADSSMKKQPKGDLDLEHSKEGHTSIRNK
ncbi:SDR family NAD(P)-dependent oxidoreductase [Pontibacter lucknowensis]|uniref:NAD(P)-dependent dehydrogenase, short-chain alcohol dehydrogenase family n=1 Tax=Pontibacter lucknowensis TaxID=1077936 RepID=A0A1N6TQF4_9BACT|nr:SDR family oxidoreductase [Pontibacter lucknowensis]SIQ55561.1 NAD(P)-dependent dehydrogenase, short-chain alcohol dehydrogenase family [Pontibacter lucknowensis]